MKKLLTILLLTLSINACIKTEVIHVPSTELIDSKTLGLKADTTINGIWDGGGKVLRINDHRIHGTGTLQHWIIDAAYTQWIFDTSINLKSIQTYDGVFSTLWLGTKSSNADNWWNIQKSINVCRDNNLECRTPGTGVYKYSKTLECSLISGGKYQQCSIHFSGDASYWDNGKGTTFQYTGTTGPAFNFQLNKGSVLDHVVFNGLWKSPGGVDSIYYNISEANYKDQSGNNLPDSYTGIAIDYNKPLDGVTRNGSTGIQMNNVSIGGFGTALSFSQNGITQNDDANSIDYLHFFDNKYCIVTGQPQEKGNSINHIYSWGSCYNVLRHFGGGNYSFKVANIAGRCIEPINIYLTQWFSSSIANWFSENIRDAASIYSEMPFSITDCTFDLNVNISKQRIALNCNSTKVLFTNCTIRYYDGLHSDVWFKGAATFNNCDFYGGNVIWK